MNRIFYAIVTVSLLTGCNSSKNDNAKMTVVVSADRMNVLYIGVDNPVTVAVSGMSSDKISVKMDDGKVTGENGQYIVNVGSLGGAKIEVFAEMPNGEKKLAGTLSFRTKRVPDPFTYFCKKKGDDIISKTELSKAEKVDAKMENFDFDMHYDVTSFEMVVSENGLSKSLASPSSDLTTEQKELLSKISSGAHIIIQNVHVKGPDSRVIPGVNLTVL